MKILNIFLLCLGIFNSGLAFASNESDPEVVSNIDLGQYQGKWYEIAHSPNFFQRKCIRSMATYKIISENKISVYNECFKEDGEKSDINGVAKVVDPNVLSKLKVRFNFFARGDYWVVMLDKNYQWSVVSGPKKKFLFILSREAPMNDDTKNFILNELKNRGFNTNNLIFDNY